VHIWQDDGKVKGALRTLGTPVRMAPLPTGWSPLPTNRAACDRELPRCAPFCTFLHHLTAARLLPGAARGEL